MQFLDPDYQNLFGQVRKVYLVGIGGAGMSGLARILKSQGFEVSGSDLKATPIVEQLQAEGIADEYIHLTGNTVIDAQRWTCERHGVKRKTGVRGHLLVTVHRRENWGHDIAEICHAIAELAEQQPELQVLFPVHLNPAIQAPVHAILGGIDNVTLVPPLDYTEMQQALVDAWLVLTDSGGLQEEAPTFGVPVLVLREETERPEAVDAGCALLIGAGRAEIEKEVARLLQDHAHYAKMSQAGNPFGDGTASAQSVEILSRTFGRIMLPGGVSASHRSAVAAVGMARIPDHSPALT